MVVRLFVPPGEGQHKLVPRRPDAIGANATLQYSILGSTSLAAAYTVFASQHSQRVFQAQPISRTALFIRSSARLGVWAALVGATLNWYYYSAFASIVVGDKNESVKPWRLYKWTKRRTVEDGALAGAALGLAASIPTLFMRRPAIPRWTRCVAMTNIGAAAGILGAHGYLQYTGERQKAYKRLERRLKRRSLEFWAIFWNKPLMAQFDPLIQQYIRHNGLWYSSNMPEGVFDQPEEYGRKSVKNKSTGGTANTAAEATEDSQEMQAYYTSPCDYGEDLKQIDVQFTLAKVKELNAERQALLDEAEFLLFYNAKKEYEYCHIKEMDDDERKRRLQEIHLCEIAFNRVRTAATAIDIKLAKWHLSLKHKELWDTTPESKDTLQSWLPTSSTIDCKTHDPALSVQEIEKFRTQISGEVKRFEDALKHPGYTKEDKARWRLDAEDGHTLLKAADFIIHDLEKTQKALQERKRPAKGIVEEVTKEVAQLKSDSVVSGPKKNAEKANHGSEQVDEQTSKTKKHATSPKGGLESDNP